MSHTYDKKSGQRHIARDRRRSKKARQWFNARATRALMEGEASK